MNKHTKNQHIVPRFLLKNFASKEGKFIWAYDNYSDPNFKQNIKERPIRKVASEEFFYDQIKNNKLGSFEYCLEKIEDISAPVILKLIENRKIESLSINERNIISLFVIFQIFRTKEKLIFTEEMCNDISNLINQFPENNYEKINSKRIWFSMLNDCFENYKLIEKKVWHLTESNNEFYISDNPVAFQNSVNVSEVRGTLGIESYGVEINMPLSPSLTISFFCEKLFQEKGYHKNYIPLITTHPENIVNLNWLQIINSDRFIFSSKNNFKFVEEIKNTL